MNQQSKFIGEVIMSAFNLKIIDRFVDNIEGV